MADVTLYLKWDGVLFKDVRDRAAMEWWCNTPERGVREQLSPPASAVGLGAAPPAAARGAGAVLEGQRAKVCLVSVSPLFAPIGEYAVIEIKIANIQTAGCLVMQIHDADDKLIYAERLTQKQIWG